MQTANKLTNNDEKWPNMGKICKQLMHYVEVWLCLLQITEIPMANTPTKMTNICQINGQKWHRIIIYIFKSLCLPFVTQNYHFWSIFPIFCPCLVIFGHWSVYFLFVFLGTFWLYGDSLITSLGHCWQLLSWASPVIHC